MLAKTGLEKIGLSQNESVVYLATLKIGEGRVSEISLEAKMSRTTVNQLLEVLREKQLVSRINKSGVYYYSGANPRTLLRINEEQKNIISEIIPKLDSLMWKASAEPQMSFLEGAEGMIQAHEILLQEATITKEYYVVCSYDIFKELPRYFPKYLVKRIQHKINAKIIMPDNEESREYQTRTGEFREVRILPSSYNISVQEVVCGEKTFYFPLRDKKFAVIIESAVIAETKKNLFNFMWNSLKPFSMDSQPIKTINLGYKSP